MLKDYRLSPRSGGKPKQVVLFLHGLGDSGSGGLLSLGQMWQNALPDCEFLCPDAPFPFDMAPPDFGGRQWFSLQNFTPESIESGTIKAAPFLNDYIDHILTTRGLEPYQMFLVGFSQGTIMSLYVAPRREKPLAGIVGYSGLLTGGKNLAAEKKSSPPVILIHGTHDEVIPYSALAKTEQGLKTANIPVQTVTCEGTGHTIDDQGLESGLNFIKSIWG